MAPDQLQADTPGGDSIVVTDPVQFLQMTRYAPDTLKHRLIYLTDGPKPNTAEVGLQRLSKFELVRIDERRISRPAHPDFWLYRRLDTDSLPRSQ